MEGLWPSFLISRKDFDKPNDGYPIFCWTDATSCLLVAALVVADGWSKPAIYAATTCFFMCTQSLSWFTQILRGIAGSLRLHYGKIWINFMTSEEVWHNCLLLLCVAPPLMFTVTSFQATPINSLAVPSPSLEVYQYNKLDMRTFCEQNFTIVSTPLRSVSAGSTFYPWD